ncbi:MAG: hypothetical protein JWO22_105 [Frankiales bacterium]|nr:hypothetical protein [Frankiales bacterium]
MTSPAQPAASPLGRYANAPDADDRLVEVQLLNVPLQLLAASREHHDELMREFRLMALSGTVPTHAAPARLIELVGVLGDRYAGASDRPDVEVDAALDRGESTLDLSYTVPASAARAAQALDALMAEADEFCRAEQLLTLERPPVLVEFAAWYLRCFVAQVAEAPPEPWNGPMVLDDV